jgi:hypothetical protein
MEQRPSEPGGTRMWRRLKWEVGRLEARYGRRVTMLLIVLTLALAPVPVPGVSFVPIWVAELARTVRGGVP